MLEDLSPAAQRVLDIAGEEATSLNHDFTGTEHILLGLAQASDDVAAPLLARHGIEADEVRARVARASGIAPAEPGHALSLTARAKQVLSLAGREADALGADDVRPEHLLLGIIRQETGVAALVLLDKGVDLAELRNEILEVLEAIDESSEAAAGEGREADASGPAGEAGAEGEGPPELQVAPPVCPSCGKPLADTVAVASLPPVAPGGSGRRRSQGNVSVIFCGSCGHTLSATR